MITRVTVKHFKRFEEEQFELDNCLVLAGPNNMGKSTLLQAIMTWKLGLDRWMQHRAGGSATKRTGVPVARQEFTAIPLREMNLMWSGRVVSAGARGTASRRIEIVLRGRDGGEEWEYGLEFEYANPEMIYVRPLGAKEKGVAEIPDTAAALQIVHVPALAGVERDEKRHDLGYQNHLIGQGRAGEILRNLLLEIAEHPGKWAELAEHVKELFGIELLEPKYGAAQPFIIVEYRPPEGRPLDLTCAGSGMLQVLLILAFLYARPASVLIMDEPDAHLHVILQKQVYDLLRRIAQERNCQLIIATHSEVLLDATSPEKVLAFVGDHPHRLTERWERNGLREAIKRLSTSDLVLASETRAVLYVEDESDARVLREWANVLEHPSARVLQAPYVHPLRGRSLREAKDHFFALLAANPDVRGLCLLDGDNRDEPDDETTRAGLRVLRWRRYEIENYLVLPEALSRFCREGQPELFASASQRAAEEFLREQLPPAVLNDPFADHEERRVVKASEQLWMPLLRSAGKDVTKADFYLLAAVMKPQEIHEEVIEKLDAIGSALLRSEPQPGK